MKDKKQPNPSPNTVFYEHTMADGTVVQYEHEPEYIQTGDGNLVPFWFAKEGGVIREWKWTPTGWVCQ